MHTDSSLHPVAKKWWDAIKLTKSILLQTFFPLHDTLEKHFDTLSDMYAMYTNICITVNAGALSVFCFKHREYCAALIQKREICTRGASEHSDIPPREQKL